ncbi:hypothetical protein C1752_10482 [Acaryochloris thomasi RCC1774]|uniref:Uncharacterized protein n=1 Tax=Acaryochloris thomasi RCC1774 TaxID=1764569 RepID=A0A2W1JHM9_9CYAN|nr:hypothetical protein C1752_10482 [Acaryochloris thomasi RCC1774]
MLNVAAAPIPCTWTASDSNDDPEIFAVSTGKSPDQAIANYFDNCLEIDPHYMNDSSEFVRFMRTY